MKKLRNQTVSVRLKNGSVAINNTLSQTPLQAAMAVFKYDAVRMNKGKVILTVASDSVDNVILKRGAQKEATRFVGLTAKTARTSYQNLAKVAHAAFVSEPGSLELLGLDKPMPRREADFYVSVQQLFNTTKYTAAIRTALAENGYDDAMLSQERAKVGEFVFAIQTRELSKGEHQQAVQDQKTALKNFKTWMSCFTKIARVAFHDKPQLLEKLGIFTRNSKTKAQRQAPAKAAATRKKNKAAVAPLSKAA